MAERIREENGVVYIGGELPILAAGIIIDSRGRRWDPRLHPRGRDGQFIEIGELLRIFDGERSNNTFGAGRVSSIDTDGRITVEITASPDHPDRVGTKVSVAPRAVTSLNEKAHLGKARNPLPPPADRKIPDASGRDIKVGDRVRLSDGTIGKVDRLDMNRGRVKIISEDDNTIRTPKAAVVEVVDAEDRGVRIPRGARMIDANGNGIPDNEEKGVEGIPEGAPSVADAPSVDTPERRRGLKAVVYHGSESDRQTHGNGLYVTDNPDVAAQFGDNVEEVELPEKVFNLDSKVDEKDATDLSAYLRDKGSNDAADRIDERMGPDPEAGFDFGGGAGSGERPPPSWDDLFGFGGNEDAAHIAEWLHQNKDADALKRTMFALGGTENEYVILHPERMQEDDKGRLALPDGPEQRNTPDVADVPDTPEQRLDAIANGDDEEAKSLLKFARELPRGGQSNRSIARRHIEEGLLADTPEQRERSLREAAGAFQNDAYRAGRAGRPARDFADQQLRAYNRVRNGFLERDRQGDGAPDAPPAPDPLQNALTERDRLANDPDVDLEYERNEMNVQLREMAMEFEDNAYRVTDIDGRDVARSWNDPQERGYIPISIPSQDTVYMHPALALDIMEKDGVDVPEPDRPKANLPDAAPNVDQPNVPEPADAGSSIEVDNVRSFVPLGVQVRGIARPDREKIAEWNDASEVHVTRDDGYKLDITRDGDTRTLRVSDPDGNEIWTEDTNELTSANLNGANIAVGDDLRERARNAPEVQDARAREADRQASIARERAGGLDSHGNLVPREWRRHNASPEFVEAEDSFMNHESYHVRQTRGDRADYLDLFNAEHQYVGSYENWDDVDARVEEDRYMHDVLKRHRLAELLESNGFSPDTVDTVRNAPSGTDAIEAVWNDPRYDALGAAARDAQGRDVWRPQDRQNVEVFDAIRAATNEPVDLAPRPNEPNDRVARGPAAAPAVSPEPANGGLIDIDALDADRVQRAQALRENIPFNLPQGAVGELDDANRRRLLNVGHALGDAFNGDRDRASRNRARERAYNLAAALPDGDARTFLLDGLNDIFIDLGPANAPDAAPAPDVVPDVNTPGTHVDRNGVSIRQGDTVITNNGMRAEVLSLQAGGRVRIRDENGNTYARRPATLGVDSPDSNRVPEAPPAPPARDNNPANPNATAADFEDWGQRADRIAEAARNLPGFEGLWDPDTSYNEKYKRIEEVFNGTYGPVEVRVNAIDDSTYIRGEGERWSGGIHVSFGLYDPETGRVIGTGQRRISVSPDGDLQVYNGYLRISDEEFRGGGFSKAFANRLEDWYIANGVNNVRVEAALETGPYTWANSGFDWDDQSSSMHEVTRLLQRINEHARTDEDREDLANIYLRVKNVQERGGGLHDPEFPLPSELARIGYRDGVEIWAGKRGLIRTENDYDSPNWHGVKYLDPFSRAYQDLVSRKKAPPLVRNNDNEAPNAPETPSPDVTPEAPRPPPNALDRIPDQPAPLSTPANEGVDVPAIGDVAFRGDFNPADHNNRVRWNAQNREGTLTGNVRLDEDGDPEVEVDFDNGDTLWVNAIAFSEPQNSNAPEPQGSDRIEFDPFDMNENEIEQLTNDIGIDFFDENPRAIDLLDGSRTPEDEPETARALHEEITAKFDNVEHGEEILSRIEQDLPELAPDEPRAPRQIPEPDATPDVAPDATPSADAQTDQLIDELRFSDFDELVAGRLDGWSSTGAQAVSINVTAIVTHNETGRRFFVKRDTYLPEGARAEVATGNIGRGAGLYIPRVERGEADPDVLVVQFAGEEFDLGEPTPAADFGPGDFDRAPFDHEGLLGMMALDILTFNTDRHDQNFMFAEDADGVRHVIPIDHGITMRYDGNRSFGSYYGTDYETAVERWMGDYMSSYGVTGTAMALAAVSTSDIPNGQKRIAVRTSLTQWAERIRESARERQNEGIITAQEFNIIDQMTNGFLTNISIITSQFPA